MYVSKFQKLIFLSTFLLFNELALCNMDILSPQDREIERTQRIKSKKSSSTLKKITIKTKEQQIKDLDNYEKTLEAKDWNSIKKRSSCLQREEKKQFERILDGLKDGNIVSGMLGVGKAIWYELIGNKCKNENPLTSKAQKYMNMLNNILIDKYRDEKNIKHEVY